MARRSRAKKRGGSFLRTGTLALACFAAGAGACWLMTRSAAGPSAGRDAAAAGGKAASGAGRAELEAEVKRLRSALDDRDKQISDLMIQIKLQNAGSPAAGAPGL